MTKVPKIVHHARTVVIRYIKETCCRTYNKGTTLIFLGVWEFTYGLNDLDTCVSINVNAIIDGATRRSINGCDSSARKKTDILRIAAVTAALLSLTATTGLSRLTAASKGTSAGFSYGKTLK